MTRAQYLLLSSLTNTARDAAHAREKAQSSDTNLDDSMWEAVEIAFAGMDQRLNMALAFVDRMSDNAIDVAAWMLRIATTWDRSLLERAEEMAQRIEDEEVRGFIEHGLANFRAPWVTQRWAGPRI